MNNICLLSEALSSMNSTPDSINDPMKVAIFSKMGIGVISKSKWAINFKKSVSISDMVHFIDE